MALCSLFILRSQSQLRSYICIHGQAIRLMMSAARNRRVGQRHDVRGNAAPRTFPPFPAGILLVLATMDRLTRSGPH